MRSIVAVFRRFSRTRSTKQRKPESYRRLALEALEQRALLSVVPVVNSIAPTAGPVDGGTSVTINGSGFTSVTAVDFGGIPANSYTVNSATQITAASPGGTAGEEADVTVTTNVGTSALSSNDLFNYEPDTIVSSISPASGPVDGGTSVTITGQYLTSVTAVDFGGTPANSYTVNSATQITATSPGGAAGFAAGVTVTTTDGGTSFVSSSDLFNYVQTPIVSSINPASGPVGGGTSVTITGQGFLTTPISVDFGGIPANGYTVNSATQITATSPGGTAGDEASVTVTTAGGTSASSSNDLFNYVLVAPAVTGISPATGPAGGGEPVTISGSGFTGAAVVDFNETPTNNFTVISDSQISVITPPGSAGLVADVTVTTQGGTSALSLADEYTYVALPSINSIAPSSGPATGGTSVTIMGTSLANATYVEFGSTEATITSDTATQITATSPPGAGLEDVTVTTAGGTSTASSDNQFSYIDTTPPGGYVVAEAGAGNLGITDPTFSDESDNLQVSFDGTNYTFEDPYNTFAFDSGALAGATISVDGHTLTVDENQASFFTGSQIILNLQAATATATLDLTANEPIDKLVDFQGGAGSDTLRVDLPAGSSLPAAGIQFNGDAAAVANLLEVSGAGQSETLSEDVASGGESTLSDSSGTIAITNLQAIDLHGLGTATIQTDLGDAPVQLIDGVDATLGGANPALRVQPDGSGIQFTTVALWNNSQVAINTANDAGSGAVTVTSADNASNNRALAIQTGGAADSIAIQGAVVVSGEVSLTAAAASIAESGGGRISAAQLTTQSENGTTLNQGNAVSSFRANDVGGGIQFSDAAAPLTIGAVSEGSINGSNGKVQIINYGGTQIAGTIQDLATAGIVSLKDFTAEIEETGAGLVSTNLLIAQAKTGMLLNGANAISNLVAVNDPNGGNLDLENTAAPLTLSSVIETGGNVTIVNSGGILIPGTIKDPGGSSGTGAVNLQDTTAGIQEEGGQIIANDLTTQSVTGTILNGNNTVGDFNATNTTSGDVQFNNNPNALLTVTGISEAGGNVQVINYGGTAAGSGMMVTGTISDTSPDTSAAGIVSVKEFNADLQESGAGAISAVTLITQSKNGTLLNGANTVSGFIAINDPNGGNVQLTNTAAPLAISEIIETGGNVTVVNNGGILIPGTIKAQTGAVNLQDTTAGIQEAGGLITAEQLVTKSVTGTILNGDNAVSSFNAVNTTSGDVQFNNNPNALLTVTGVSEAGGNVQVINYGGTTVGSGILITGPISDNVAGATLSIKEWSADIEENGSGAIDAETLVTQSKRGTLLTGDNVVYGFIAINDPNGGNMQLNDNTGSLNIAEIIETGGNVVVDNTGAITEPSGAIQTTGTVTLDPNDGEGGPSGSAASHDLAILKLFGSADGAASPVVSPAGADHFVTTAISLEAMLE